MGERARTGTGQKDKPKVDAISQPRGTCDLGHMLHFGYSSLVFKTIVKSGKLLLFNSFNWSRYVYANTADIQCTQS